MTDRLKGKIALVTGAGAGIGAATARRFAEEGAIVIATDINEAAVQDVADEIKAAGGRAEALQQDVTDEARWAALVADIQARHGALHVLVNNAGMVVAGSAEEGSLADWRRTQAVNGESVFMGTRAAIGVMKDCGGSIINISSIEGIIGEPLVAAYNYSKGGVRIFTKSAALHCAKAGYNIRVNSVHPGFIGTQLVANALAVLPQEQQAELAARLERDIPMGGAPGEPLDIANGCLFLASDESRYMTGAELVIDGGYTCH
jgi:NAD(P)-dependent dehydrogenase (short-subunit alcohol dehydrogenase family)